VIANHVSGGKLLPLGVLRMEMMMRLTPLAVAALLAAPAYAQAPAAHEHTINVAGHGEVDAAPDTALIHYWVRGEGKTPDEASRAMVNSQKQVESGLKGFLGPEATITNSNLIVMEVRDPKCSNRDQPQLSDGNCAIVGYLARSEGDVTTSQIDKAGTAVGLAGRFGARDTRLQGFELRDTGAARREAMTKAVADAREQAQILATAAGGRLGPVLNIQYGNYGGIVAEDIGRFAAAPPPPPPPPPVEIDVKPRSQEITAQVNISYELLP
jgi:uncharacterized protein